MSVTINAVTYTVTIDDFISLADWATYFNTKVTNQNIKIVEVANANSWENVLYFKFQLNNGDVGATLSGSAWAKLGMATGI
jgi:hypothetical protein